MIYWKGHSPNSIPNIVDGFKIQLLQNEKEGDEENWTEVL